METRKSYATQDTYEGYLKKWIFPPWRSYHLGDVKTVSGGTMAAFGAIGAAQQGTKIRNIMSALGGRRFREAGDQRDPLCGLGKANGEDINAAARPLPRPLLGHCRRLHPGDDQGETRGTKQSRQDDSAAESRQKRGDNRGSSLIEPFRTPGANFLHVRDRDAVSHSPLNHVRVPKNRPRRNLGGEPLRVAI